MSADPPEKLRKWAARKGFPFPLLAAGGPGSVDAWGVRREWSLFGRRFAGISRATFLVGPDGTVLRAWPRVNPLGHARDVLAALRSARKG